MGLTWSIEPSRTVVRSLMECWRMYIAVVQVVLSCTTLIVVLRR